MAMNKSRDYIVMYEVISFICIVTIIVTHQTLYLSSSMTQAVELESIRGGYNITNENIEYVVNSLLKNFLICNTSNVLCSVYAGCTQLPLNVS